MKEQNTKEFMFNLLNGTDGKYFAATLKDGGFEIKEVVGEYGQEYWIYSKYGDRFNLGGKNMVSLMSWFFRVIAMDATRETFERCEGRFKRNLMKLLEE